MQQSVNRREVYVPGMDAHDRIRGSLVGLAVGAVVALVATPVLVRAATGSVGTMPLAFDVPPLLAGLAVLAAGAAGLVALHARTVVRQAEDRDLREVSA